MAVDATKVTPAAAPSDPAPAAPSAPAAPVATDPGASAAPPEAAAPDHPVIAELLTLGKVQSVDELRSLVSKRLPDLMSQRDRTANELAEAKAAIDAKDGEWIRWIKDQALAGSDARALVSSIERAVGERSTQVTTAKATEADALRLINAALEEGDRPFAAFLRAAATAAGGRLDPGKIETYKQAFSTVRGVPVTAPAPAAPAAAATGPRTPPNTPSPGASGTPPIGPAWTGGDMARTLLSSKKR